MNKQYLKWLDAVNENRRLRIKRMKMDSKKLMTKMNEIANKIHKGNFRPANTIVITKDNPFYEEFEKKKK